MAGTWRLVLQWLQVGLLQDIQHCRVSAESGWPSVSIRWPGEIGSLICSFCVAGHDIVWADPPQRYSWHVAGKFRNQATATVNLMDSKHTVVSSVLYRQCIYSCFFCTLQTVYIQLFLLYFTDSKHTAVSSVLYRQNIQLFLLYFTDKTYSCFFCTLQTVSIQLFLLYFTDSKHTAVSSVLYRQ